MSDSKQAAVTGNVKWASIQQPNTKFEPMWCLDIVVDTAVGQKLTKAGLPVKTDKDGDLILKVKRKVAKKGGGNNKPPVVVDRDNNPFDELVGNGSKCKVEFSMFDWEVMGNKGTSAWLNKVTVLEHVPFAGGGDVMDFTPEETVDAPAATDEIDFNV